MRFERGPQLSVAYGGAKRPGQDHEIHPGIGAGWPETSEVGFEPVPKAFSNDSLDPVSAHGMLVHLAGNRQAKAAGEATIGPDEDLEIAI